MRAIDRYASPRAYAAGQWGAHSGGASYWYRNTSLWDTGAFTICGWVQADTAAGTFYRTIACHMNSSSSILGWIGFSPTDLAIATQTGVAHFGNTPWSLTTLFYAISGDGTTASDAIKGYARQPHQKSLTSATLAGSATTTMNQLRFASDNNNNVLQCRQWDVRIWDTQLTERELMLESLRPGPVRRSNLRGWYPLKGSFGSTADLGTSLFDYSDDGAHMTPTAGDVRNIYPRYFSVRQNRRYRPLAIAGESIATSKVPIWALSNSLRSRQHV